jgi:membrane AbrB-like protein
MVVMAGTFGADMLLVAFMQYLRVFVAVLVATIVARLWIGPSGAASALTDWFPPLRSFAFGSTVLLIGASSWLADRLRIPAGSILVPLFAGAVLNNLGIIAIQLPPWLLACAYMVVGWQVGSRFDRAILLHAAKAMPQLLMATCALIGMCAGIAALLVLLAGIDPLTAYLATSPGGINSVAIIGISGKADMAFVMAMQTSRMILVLMIEPWLARFVAESAVRRR